jgi:hypothetical protein
MTRPIDIASGDTLIDFCLVDGSLLVTDPGGGSRAWRKRSLL